MVGVKGSKLTLLLQWKLAPFFFHFIFRENGEQHEIALSFLLRKFLFGLKMWLSHWCQEGQLYSS